MREIHVPPSDLTTVLRAYRENTRFILDSGIYKLGTNWSFSDLDHVCLGAGCELIGRGSKSTIIESLGNAPIGAAQIECLTAGNRTGRYTGSVKIHGISLYCAGAAERTGILGVHCWSGKTDLFDVEVSGVWGNRTPTSTGASREGFGILINGADYLGSGSASVRNCSVEGYGYVTGIYVGIANPTGPSFVRDCVATCDGWAHAAFGTNGGTHWNNIANVGPWERGVFCDVTGGSDTIISNAMLRASKVLVEFRGSGPMVWRRLVVTDSILEAVGHTTISGYSAGLVLAADGGDPTFDAVQIRNSILDCRGSKVPTYIGSANSQDTAECGLRHCDLLGDWQPVQLGPKAPKEGFLVL